MAAASTIGLSVLVPTYNSAQFLPESISSVETQLTSDDEIISRLRAPSWIATWK